ncbi:MAG: proline racemase family protein, partial [Tagaea sp.]|nr:proline racemase family protein [Tagaea sp.]
NNVGFLGMCGHGTIGLAVTLAYLGRIGPGTHRFETPVGTVGVDLLGPNEAEIENVPSYRHRKDVAIEVEGLGTIVGDVAWGGNWFFLVSNAPRALTMAEIPALTRAAEAVSAALDRAGIRGADGGKIDHIEFFGPPVAKDARSRNFVLCPGGAYDRSPCGTGTSAKLACLAADGKLAPGDIWVQESVVGSRFEGRYRPGTDGKIVPRIRGRAYVVADTTLLRDPGDPFADGMRG